MAIHKSGCSASGGVSAPSLKAEGVQFLDFDYVEIVLDTTPHPKAIAIGVDPYIMIRPEGRWPVPGILERSAIRPVTRPSVAKQRERARA
jgi:hypothetical protein